MAQYELPAQLLVQQSSAPAISGEDLKTYGKHAAALYAKGAANTLNDAVVQAVKSAGLGPEHVRRVCEFANTSAFLEEFNKEGTANKYVYFVGGPANYGEVLKELNSGGHVVTVRSGDADYSHAPMVVKKAAGRQRAVAEKTAGASNEELGAPADSLLREIFQVDNPAPPIPYHNPFGDVSEMRVSLAAARDQLTSDISHMEVALLDATEAMCGAVKEAYQAGTPLGHVVQAWDQVVKPDQDLVKAAWAIITPYLRQSVDVTLDEIGASLEKTASNSAVVDDQHPIIGTFAYYTDLVQKLAHARAARNELVEGIQNLDTFYRQASLQYGMRPH